MSEQRLIDANALKDKFCYGEHESGSDNAWIMTIRRMIEEAPTIEAEPVRHGKWTDPEDDDDGTEWHCSECGSVVETLGWYPQVRFCHNCGARMDGDAT